MISIINYGVGNISAFKSAYDKLNIPIEEITNPENLKDATHIILPGVGSFKSAMDKISSAGFIEPLTRQVIEKKSNVLGVCVGLQIMGESSEESPSQEGLGWIKVNSLRMSNKEIGEKIILPHIGWNNIVKTKECPLLEGIGTDEFYFLHSFNIEILDQSSVSSKSYYGREFSSSFSMQNIYGTQFHPEKSHKQGLRLLHNFASL